MTELKILAADDSFLLGPHAVSFTAIINIGNIPIWNFFNFLSIWIHEGHIRIVCLVVFFFVQDSGDIHFLASVQDWYDPYNWQDIASFKVSSIILHTDNVPCVHDTAVFPQVIMIKALAISLYPFNVWILDIHTSFLGSIINFVQCGKMQLSLSFTSNCALHFEWKIKHVDLKSFFVRLSHYLI